MAPECPGVCISRSQSKDINVPTASSLVLAPASILPDLTDSCANVIIIRMIDRPLRRLSDRLCGGGANDCFKGSQG
jgi:hypothetical protein